MNYFEVDGEPINAAVRIVGGRNHSRRGIELFIGAQETGYGVRRTFDATLNWQLSSPHCEMRRAIMLDDDESQTLIDVLWQAGMRPTELTGVGQIEALNEHLRDLRTLVFGSESTRNVIELRRDASVDLVKSLVERIADLQRQLEHANRVNQTLLAPAFFYGKESAKDAHP